MIIEKVPKRTLFLQVLLAEAEPEEGLRMKVSVAGDGLIFDFGKMDDRYKVPIGSIAYEVYEFRKNREKYQRRS